MDPGPLALALLGGFAMFLAVGGVDAAGRPRWCATAGGRSGWATGFLVISYAIDYLAQVWSMAEPLGPLSVFHYLDPPEVLRTGSLGAGDVLALAGLAAVATVAALVLVGRRDLTP